MEILKKFFQTFIILGLLTTTSFAQDYTKQIRAFQESYLQEAAGEIQKSIDVLKNIYDEDSYEINLRLGWLSYQQGLFSESMAYYNKAILLKPLSIEAKFGYVYPSSAAGNWNHTIKQYKDILEICPNNSVANHRLGLIYYGREEYSEAYKYFEKVVNLFPFDYDGLIMFGWTNYKLHRVREARILFQKALLHTPGGSSAIEGLEQIK